MHLHPGAVCLPALETEDRAGTCRSETAGPKGRWEGSPEDAPMALGAETDNLGDIIDEDIFRGMLSVSIIRGAEAVGVAYNHNNGMLSMFLHWISIWQFQGGDVFTSGAPFLDRKSVV